MASTTLNSLVVSNSGRVSFSGLGSGIDFQTTVDALIAAKRIPVDRLETKVSANQSKIAAFQDVRAGVARLQDSLKNLYGAVTVDRSRDIFEAKQAFASASRTDGQGASNPANLLGVTVTNQATVGKHTIEVVQTAASHRVGSGAFTSVNTDLGTALGLGPNSVSGTIEIAGAPIDVMGTDTLQSLVDRVNNANRGPTATGVTASIVRVSATESYMALTVDKAGRSLGTDVAVADPDGVLAQLGFLDGGDFANEFQAARKARFYADGIIDPVNKEPLLIERDSNTISDLFAGVTLSLYQAEPGTTVTIDIDRNLSQAKTAITGFADAYNELRGLLNFHLRPDPATGKPREDAALFGSSALVDIETRLSRLVGTGAQGANAGFTVLPQIGVNFTGGAALADPLLNGTLTIDNEKLEQALIGNIDGVKKMFAFDFAPSTPQITLLGFDGRAAYKADGYTLDVTWDAVNGRLAGATIDGEPATVNGRRITVENGPAKGLILYYNGGADANGIALDFSVGLGASMFFDLGNLLDPKTGLIETEIGALTTNNEKSRARIEEMTVRLDLQRERLLAKYIAMETALTSMNQTIESLKQMTESMFRKD
ncbi:MAG: flagellar filament capping protein FliD [Alphaproteobacteria bacterium]